MSNDTTPTSPESLPTSLAEGIPKQDESTLENLQEYAEAVIQSHEQAVDPADLPESANPDQPPTPPMCHETQEPDETVSSAGTDGRSDTAGVESVPLDEHGAEWTRYFRYDAAYHDQIDAIDSFLNLLADNGLYLFEDACGTGKTLAAVTAGLHAIRDRDHLCELPHSTRSRLAPFAP